MNITETSVSILIKDMKGVTLKDDTIDDAIILFNRLLKDGTFGGLGSVFFNVKKYFSKDVEVSVDVASVRYVKTLLLNKEELFQVEDLDYYSKKYNNSIITTFKLDTLSLAATLYHYYMWDKVEPMDDKEVQEYLLTQGIKVQFEMCEFNLN